MMAWQRTREADVELAFDRIPRVESAYFETAARERAFRPEVGKQIGAHAGRLELRRGRDGAALPGEIRQRTVQFIARLAAGQVNDGGPGESGVVHVGLDSGQLHFRAIPDGGRLHVLHSKAGECKRTYLDRPFR